MNTSYRLLFLDLDGTLVGKNDEITPRTLSALHHAQQNDCIPVICTARARYSSQKIATSIGGNVYSINYNGAIIFDWASNRVERKLILPEQSLGKILTAAYREDLAPMCLGVEDDDRWVYVDCHLPLHPGYELHSRSRLIFHEDLSSTLSEAKRLPISVQVFGNHQNTLAVAEAWRQEQNSSVVVFHTYTERYEGWCAQIFDARAEKGNGAKTVAEMLKVPQKQTIAVGDQIPDLSMIRWAGLGICMGDGDATVQDGADYITGTLAEEGVAQAIEKFVLRQKRQI